MRSDEVERLLPEVFRRTLGPESVLEGLCHAIAELFDPAERALAALHQNLDPRQASEEFVDFLARWVDLGELPVTTGLGHRRELVASAAALSRWRGTLFGLLRFLQIGTGSDAFSVEERVLDADDRPIPFHIRIRAPAELRAHRPMIERIIEMEKPAYVTYDLELEGD